MPHLIYNSHLYLTEELKISPLNRGSLFGDGFFETLISVDGKIHYFPQHYERLAAAALACGIILPSELTPSLLESQISDLLESNGSMGIQRIRFTCWRGGQGLYTPESDEGEYIITTQPGVAAPQIKSVVKIFDGMYKPYSMLSFCKTLSANIYAMAARAKKMWKIDDVIILGANGTIAECSASNIFFVRDNIVYTPHLLSGCIAGIMRHQIQSWCTLNGISFIQKEISIEQLMSADAVFTANVTGLSWVGQVEHVKFSIDHLVVQKIMLALGLIRQ